MMKYLCAISLLILISCGTSRTEDDKTNFRIINVVTDAGSINVLVDEKSYIDDLRFGESLGYENINTGSHDILVTEENGFIPLVDSSISLSDRRDSTLLIFGTVEEPESKVLRDENDQPDGDITKIRVIHASSKTDSVDVYVIASGASIEGLSPTVESINYRGDSDYTFSSQGRYTVIITERDSKTAIFESEPQLFDAEGIYSLIIIDGQGELSTDLLILKDR